MASAFGWLDHSEQQRRQMLEIVDLFREKGTLDELGIGAIRDAFADRFFPGTSTLHTRARYLLFIPWVLTGLEHKRVPSARFDERARSDQATLVRALEAGGESRGRHRHQRPGRHRASTQRHLLERPASGTASCATPTRTRATSARSIGTTSMSVVRCVRMTASSWRPVRRPGTEHSRRRPPGCSSERQFALTWAEADYLRERIVTQQSGTLLAEFVSHRASVARVPYPWDHPAWPDLPQRMRSELADARRFSLLAEGAYLLYNLVLAEAAVAAGMTAREGYPERYRTSFARWSDEMTAEAELFADWEVVDLWETTADFGAAIPLRTRRFVERWAGLALGPRDTLADDPVARRLIADREHELKRSLARLQSRRALENWGGASSLGRLDYRWGNARQLIADIKAGLRRSAEDGADA